MLGHRKRKTYSVPKSSVNSTVITLAAEQACVIPEPKVTVTARIVPRFCRAVCTSVTEAVHGMEAVVRPLKVTKKEVTDVPVNVIVCCSLT